MVRSAVIGATLATCDDAAVLVPGAPEGLRADADHLDRQGHVLAQHAIEIRDAHAAQWTGTAADAWASRQEQFAQTLDAVSQLHLTAAGTLRLHADAVEWGQGRARVAIRMYAEGCRLREADPAHGGALFAAAPGPLAADAGAQHRALAEDVLASAQQQVAASSRAAAAVLDQFSAGLPDGKWHLGDFATGIWSWVTGIAELLWKFNNIRAIVDPKGVLRDGRELFDGGADLHQSFVDDPLQTSRRLAQLGLLQDHPAQWWGGLAPDVALAAAGGAGLAAKGLRGAALVDDIASTGEDMSVAARRLYDAGSRWEDSAERARWLEDYTRGPVEENPNLRRIPLNRPEDFFQLGETGLLETRISGLGKEVWADGVMLDPDAVAAVEVKYSGTPGRSPYTGTAPPFLVERAMEKFDDHITRYAAALADESNPVARMRLVTNEQAVADFLGPRARTILGPDVDFEVVVRSE